MAEINPQNPIVTALLGLLSGGAVTAILARVVPSKKETLDDATAYRAELRSAIEDLQLRQDKLETEVTDWRNKYFALLEEHTILRAEHAAMRAELEGLRTRMNNGSIP